LAAAYAEAGDFKRAAQYEHQALAAAPLSEEQQKRMEDALMTYKHEKPRRVQEW
jgi:hypothetical protein